MLSAQNIHGDVLAWQVTKPDGPFFCPVCREPVLVKKGNVKVHHFAHIPPTNCLYGRGESEEHRQAKKEIYEALRNHSSVTDLQLERYLGEVRPDISFSLGNKPVAVEVQISTLSLDVVLRRTRAYTRMGYSLLWISPLPHNLTVEERYAPRLWEKFLHAMYFGKVYYWHSGEELLLVHFDDYHLYVAGGYDADGQEHEGSYRRSKRFRTPTILKSVRISELSSSMRKPWESKTFSIPQARLWCDKAEVSA